MPFHSSLSQGNDLLRQFFMTLVPGFAPPKENELKMRIGKINRLPGISIQEGLSYNTNKTNPFVPDFNGSGFAPFMFAGGYLPNGVGGPTAPGDTQTDPNNQPGGGGGGDRDGGGWNWDPDGPPDRPIPGSTSSNSSGSLGSSSSSSAFADVSGSSGSGSGIVIVADIDGGNEDTGEPMVVVLDAMTAPDTEIVDGNT